MYGFNIADVNLTVHNTTYIKKKLLGKRKPPECQNQAQKLDIVIQNRDKQLL